MVDEKWAEAKFEGFDKEISAIREVLVKLADGFNELTASNAVVNSIDKATQDHESRLRKIEEKQWIVGLAVAVFTAGVVALVTSSINLIDAAEEQQPMSREEIALYVAEAIKQTKEKDENSN